MKFITEEDLREAYKREPFVRYEIPLDTRLTPGARQFLLDWRVQIIDGQEKRHGQSCAEQVVFQQSKGAVEASQQRLLLKMATAEALFLCLMKEIQGNDVFLDRQLIALYQRLGDIRRFAAEKTPLPPFLFKACTGIAESQATDCLLPCFEVTEFHLQKEKGKEIAGLHHLRCVIHEMAILESEGCAAKEVVDSLLQIMNTLSQMICCTAGGEKCQRQ